MFLQILTVQMKVMAGVGRERFLFSVGSLDWCLSCVVLLRVPVHAEIWLHHCQHIPAVWDLVTPTPSFWIIPFGFSYMLPKFRTVAGHCIILGWDGIADFVPWDRKLLHTIEPVVFGENTVPKLSYPCLRVGFFWMIANIASEHAENLSYPEPACFYRKGLWHICCWSLPYAWLAVKATRVSLIVYCPCWVTDR